MTLHKSVLLKETIDLLNVQQNRDYIDCTFGGGGHTRAILEASAPDGQVLAIDLDQEALAAGRKSLASFGSRLALVHGSFRDIVSIAADNGFDQGDGILYDLGLSTDQLSGRGRGFSFKEDEPLDMRFSFDTATTAADIVNTVVEKDLADLIYQYGEERQSRRIARRIVEEREKKRIATTKELVDIIVRAYPPKLRHGRIHCATKTFQALRIAVNDELENLKDSLPDAFGLLKPSGRLAVISFHSLEDRVVKHQFKQWAKDGKAELLVKKPLTPTKEEQSENPASRSAKLRAIQKK